MNEMNGIIFFLLELDKKNQQINGRKASSDVPRYCELVVALDSTMALSFPPSQTFPPSPQFSFALRNSLTVHSHAVIQIHLNTLH